MTYAEATAVPEIEVVVLSTELVVMTGAVVDVPIPIHTYTPGDSHFPDSV
jgi:hypothetical protein